MIAQIIAARLTAIRAEWHETTDNRRRDLLAEMAVLFDILRALPKELRRAE